MPLSQAVLLDIYPREQHGTAMAIWGVGIMVGPILGPTLGGWLTDNYNWRWVFYINLPVGILALLGMLAFVPETGARPRAAVRPLRLRAAQPRHRRAPADARPRRDQGLVRLDRDHRSRRSSPAVGLWLFVVHMCHGRAARSSSRALFKDRNFVAGLIFIFVVGIVLFATLALLPPFLQNLMGYPVLTTGLRAGAARHRHHDRDVRGRPPDRPGRCPRC